MTKFYKLQNHSSEAASSNLERISHFGDHLSNNRHCSTYSEGVNSASDNVINRKICRGNKEELKDVGSGCLKMFISWLSKINRLHRSEKQLIESSIWKQNLSSLLLICRLYPQDTGLRF